MTGRGVERGFDSWAEGVSGLQAMKIDNDSTMPRSIKSEPLRHETL